MKLIPTLVLHENKDMQQLIMTLHITCIAASFESEHNILLELNLYLNDIGLCKTSKQNFCINVETEIVARFIHKEHK